MGSVFPTSKDNFTDPTAGSPLTGHASLHEQIADAIEELETKVGVDSSTDATSIDYKLNHLGDTYYTETEVDNLLAGKQDSGSYLTTTGTAADSSKLGGQLPSYYSVAHSHPYLGSTAKAADSDKLDGVDGSNYARLDQANGSNIRVDVNGGDDWTVAQLIANAPSNATAAIAIRGSSDINTVQLRAGNASSVPLLYLRDHDDQDNAQLHCGRAWFYGDINGSGNFNYSSSRDIKNSIEDYSGALNTVAQLRPVTYRLNDDPSDRVQIGLIAEEVLEVEPRLVIDDELNPHLGLSINSLLGLAIAGLNEANTRIAALESRVAQLEAGS